MVDTRRLSQLVGSVKIELPPSDLVIALSGGADSAALAYLVARQGRAMRAVHVNHGLEHSPTMEDAATAVAAHLDVPLEVVRTVVPDGASVEARARSARYEALREATTEDEAVLTAHTADDNLETVIINLSRGTGIKGLAGIPPHRAPNIFRPLLGASRSELREIAVLAGVPFVDDPMNLDPAITRNRIRMTVIPRLQELNPAVVETVSRMTETVRHDADYLDSLTEQLSPVENTVRIPIGRLKTMPRALADRLLMEALELCGLEVSRERIDRIRAVVTGESEREQISGPVFATRTGPLIVIGEEDPDAGDSLPLTPGQHRFAGLEFDVIAVDGICRVAPLSRWHAIFPKGTTLVVGSDGTVAADGDGAWVPGEKRLPVAWYEPGDVGYLSVFAREESGWT